MAEITPNFLSRVVDGLRSSEQARVWVEEQLPEIAPCITSCLHYAGGIDFPGYEVTLAGATVNGRSAEYIWLSPGFLPAAYDEDGNRLGI